MKTTRVLMGMPITVEIVDPNASEAAIEKIFDYFKYVDETFSTYKTTSEITAINNGALAQEKWSADMKLIFALSEKTKVETKGFFDIRTPGGTYDPSGIVKGWAIWNAAQLLRKDGFENFYVDAGGDIQPNGLNTEGKPWAVGIKNPWNEKENVKVVYVTREGVATSGTYIRGLHIYDPKHANRPVDEITSLTVIGPNVYEADRFATAAFAMGRDAITFIEELNGFEGYMIDNEKIATLTSGFEKYTKPSIKS
jgi:thiamine biosynthesis lipoprotein